MFKLNAKDDQIMRPIPQILNVLVFEIRIISRGVLRDSGASTDSEWILLPVNAGMPPLHKIFI